MSASLIEKWLGRANDDLDAVKHPDWITSLEERTAGTAADEELLRLEISVNALHLELATARSWLAATFRLLMQSEGDAELLSPDESEVFTVPWSHRTTAVFLVGAALTRASQLSHQLGTAKALLAAKRSQTYRHRL